MTRSWSTTSRRRHCLEEIASACVPTLPTILRACSWSARVCLALLFLASGATAQAPDYQASDATPLADQEPITPIPSPPAADPRKLALGERLFGDPRLSGDGKLATCEPMVPAADEPWPMTGRNFPSTP